MKASASDINKGEFLEDGGTIYQVVNIDHSHVGRGSANLKIKLKSVSQGNTLLKTYKPDHTIEKVSVESKKMQYLFKDDSFLTFMDNDTYDQVQVPIATASSFVDFLKEGTEAYVVTHDGSALAVNPPHKIALEVAEAQDAAKGNTATNARKSVTLETGAEIMVPIFIKKGEMIYVNPENGEYVERVN